MNCEYCGTQIFKQDRNCVKCGAPFHAYSDKQPFTTFGDLMRSVDEFDPTSFPTSASYIVTRQDINMRAGVNNRLLHEYYEQEYKGNWSKNEK